MRNPPTGFPSTGTFKISTAGLLRVAVLVVPNSQVNAEAPRNGARITYVAVGGHQPVDTGLRIP